MESLTDFKICVYHSPDWDILVETGWMTQDVFEVDGLRLARMVRADYPRCTLWSTA